MFVWVILIALNIFLGYLNLQVNDMWWVVLNGFNIGFALACLLAELRDAR